MPTTCCAKGFAGISDLITQPGLINLDFADVKTIMTDAGSAMMGIGEGTGEHRAADAAQKAIASPLLETTIEGARGVIFNITGGPDMAMYEVNEAAEMISRAVDSEAQIIFGASIDPTMTGKVRVTVLAAGFGAPRAKSNGRLRVRNRQDRYRRAGEHGRHRSSRVPSLQRVSAEL